MPTLAQPTVNAARPGLSVAYTHESGRGRGETRLRESSKGFARPRSPFLSEELDPDQQDLEEHLISDVSQRPN